MDAGLIDRFGTLDATRRRPIRPATAGRWSGSARRATRRRRSLATASRYDLDLFSNFTYFLDDPENGDQFQQADHRVVTGAKVTHRRLGTWFGRPMQNTFGAQVRHDAIRHVGLYHTVVAHATRRPLAKTTCSRPASSGFAQNETSWTPWLRTLAGLRVDGYRFDVEASDPRNSGTDTAGLASPKGGVVLGPWAGTELYANAGFGFHSNDARGATITVDPTTGEPADRVTPLARAQGAEVGLRTVRVPTSSRASRSGR